VGIPFLLSLLQSHADSRPDKSKPLTVGVIGYPNVGKSSLINSLVGTNGQAAISPTGGHTTQMQEIQLSSDIVLLDSPGVVYAEDEDSLLRNCVDPDTAPTLPVVKELLSRCDHRDLATLYNIGDFEGDVGKFLEMVGEKKGEVGGGEKVAAAVVRDWNEGNIPFYVEPPKEEERVGPKDEEDMDVDVDDGAGGDGKGTSDVDGDAQKDEKETTSATAFDTDSWMAETLASEHDSRVLEVLPTLSSSNFVFTSAPASTLSPTSNNNNHPQTQYLDDDIPGVIHRVSTLFAGNKKLVLGFKKFLPEGYKIELPVDGRGPPTVVYQAEGQENPTVLYGPGAPGYVSTNFDDGKNSLPQDGSEQGNYDNLSSNNNPNNNFNNNSYPPAPPNNQVPGQQQPGQQPVEFNHAINYVTTIKKRFQYSPDTYKKFLEILHTYQKEQRGIKEVLDEVSGLFWDHPDLLGEFIYFLPDGVQAEAKRQLGEMVEMREDRLRKQGRLGMDAGRPGEMRQHQVNYQQPAQQNHQQAQPFHKLRSEETEKEIASQASYGTITFVPPKPSSTPPVPSSTPATTITSIPPPPTPPTVTESLLFDQIRKHLSLPSLQRSEKSPSSTTPRTTPWVDFIKCLHLFAARVTDLEETIALFRPLLLQGHALKTSLSQQEQREIGQEAEGLIEDFRAMVNNRRDKRPKKAVEEKAAEEKAAPEIKTEDTNAEGVKMEDETDADAATNDAATNDNASTEIASPQEDAPASTAAADPPQPPASASLKYESASYSTLFAPDKNNNPTPVTPSYSLLPSDYLSNAHPLLFSSRTPEDSSYLNDSVVPIKTKITDNVKNHEGAKSLKNHYENELFILEEQRFELDRIIDVNTATIRQMDPVVKEITIFKKKEENDGQPVGRLQYKLKRRTFTTSHVNAIKRLYGPFGDQIIEHVGKNPFAVLPIVMNRLLQKDKEWRQLRSECNLRWKDLQGLYFRGSLDLTLKKQIATYAGYWESRGLVEYTKQNTKTAENVKPTYKPLSDAWMSYHRHSYMLIKAFTGFSHSTSRIWLEFMRPFYDYPVEMVLQETHHYDPNDTRNPIYPPGVMVSTSFGDGHVIGYNPEEKKYEIKLPYGVGFLQGGSILSIVGDKAAKSYVGRDHANGSHLVKQSDPVKFKAGGASNSKQPFEFAYVGPRMYLFMQYHSLLNDNLICAKGMLDRAKIQKEKDQKSKKNVSLSSQPDEHEVNDTSQLWLEQNQTEAERDAQKARELTKKELPYEEGFVGILRLVASKKITQLQYEDCCRSLCNFKYEDFVDEEGMLSKLCALPELIKLCGESLASVAAEMPTDAGIDNGLLRDFYNCAKGSRSTETTLEEHCKKQTNMLFKCVKDSSADIGGVKFCLVNNKLKAAEFNAILANIGSVGVKVKSETTSKKGKNSGTKRSRGSTTTNNSNNNDATTEEKSGRRPKRQRAS